MVHDYISVVRASVRPAGRRGITGNRKGGQCRGAGAGTLPGKTGGQPDQKRFHTF